MSSIPSPWHNFHDFNGVIAVLLLRPLRTFRYQWEAWWNRASRERRVGDSAVPWHDRNTVCLRMMEGRCVLRSEVLFTAASGVGFHSLAEHVPGLWVSCKDKPVISVA